MTLQPCHRCPIREGCDIHKEKLRHLRGAKLSSARFNCEKLRAHIAPGMEVRANLQYVWTGKYHPVYRDERDDAMSGEMMMEPATLVGTVMRWATGTEKILVFFPDQEAGKLFALNSRQDNGKPRQINILKIWPKSCELTGRSEPVCPHCHVPNSQEGCEFSCDEGCSPPRERVS